VLRSVFDLRSGKSLYSCTDKTLHMYVSTYAHTYICTYVCVSHARMNLCMHVRTCLNVYGDLCVCVCGGYVRMHVYIYISVIIVQQQAAHPRLRSF
jgi:hypothetical protein